MVGINIQGKEYFLDNCPSCKLKMMDLGRHLEFAHQEEVVMTFHRGEDGRLHYYVGREDGSQDSKEKESSISAR